MTKNKGGEKRATPKKPKTKKLTASELIEMFRAYDARISVEDYVVGIETAIKYMDVIKEIVKLRDYALLPEIFDSLAHKEIEDVKETISREGYAIVDGKPSHRRTDLWHSWDLDAGAIPTLISYLNNAYTSYLSPLRKIESSNVIRLQDYLSPQEAKKIRSKNFLPEEGNFFVCDCDFSARCVHGTIETHRILFAIQLLGKICKENEIPADLLGEVIKALNGLIRKQNIVQDAISGGPQIFLGYGNNIKDTDRALNDTAILAMQLISGAEKMHKEAVTENMDTWISNLQSHNSKSDREDAISNLKKVGSEKAINALNEALLREAQALSSITDSFERYQFGRKESLYTHILHVLKEITDPSSLKPIQDCLSILSNDLGQLDAMSTASALKKFKKGGTKFLVKGLTSDNEVYQAQCLASLVDVKKPIKEKRKIVRTELDKLDFDNYRKITHRVLGYGFKHADFIGSIYKMKGKDHAIRMLRDALLGFKEGDYFYQWLDGHNNEDFHILNNASHQLTLIGSNQALGILKQAKSKVKDKELKRIISEYINDFGKKHVPEDDDEFGDEEFDMMPL